MSNKTAKNSFGYVIVKWEVEPREDESKFPKTVFTVLDADEKGDVGGFKYYGKGMPKDLRENIGKAVIQAHWHQRHEIPAVD